jgi:ABC-type polysaccharide/polyol phosphate transport system ATPase subunit
VVPWLVEVTGLGKRFRDDTVTPASIRQRLSGLLRHRPARHLTVLDKVDFAMPPGQSVAVLGRNGSGKSTLLRVIAGVYAPTHGRVTVNGRIAGVLSLGLGFHAELSGAENMATYAAIIGLDRRSFAARFQSMAAFSGVGDAIHRPVKHYSTGMQGRIALAVALFADPDLLIVDEALSVGDQGFRDRIRQRLAAYHAAGGSSLIVAHDTSLLREQCQRGVWLEAGRIVMDDTIDEVVAAYEAGRS